MSSEDFIELCKDKIELYLDSQAEYDIYTIWKDYWMVGSSLDATTSVENQRAIFGTTLNAKYFDCTYDGNASKLYMKVYDIDDTEEYTITPTV